MVLIAVVGLIAVGPSEIPGLLHGAGRLFRRVTYIRYAFSRQFDEFMQESGMDDLSDQVNFEARAHENADFNEDDEDAAYFDNDVSASGNLAGGNDPDANKYTDTDGNTKSD